MVHSFGSSAPPFTTHSVAFESTIKRELGTAVDLDEVSLDMARYAQPDMEEAFAEFLVKRISEWQPDLVVPIGSPAGKFVAKFRDKLFPRTPVIYTGMDRRTLPDDAFAKNATFVGENFDLKGLVEDMLQLDPETNHVVVILGASPLERYWTTVFREAFAPFAGRVKFTYVNDLSFEQMLDLASKLPPHSFVLLGLLMRDASGVTYNEDDALARLHRVSSAPINGMFQNEVGLGIVGGRLYQGELEGVESAHVAARILRGEPASKFPPLFIGTREPTYDWRELRRWGFSEGRLPPGSVGAVPRAHHLGTVPVATGRGGRGDLDAGGVDLRAVFPTPAAARRRGGPAVRGGRRAAAAGRAGAPGAGRVAGGIVGGAGARAEPAARARSRPTPPPGSGSSRARSSDLAEVRDTLADIESDTKRAGEVIHRLRGMLKRGAPAGFAPVDLNDVVRSVERLVRSDGVRHGVTVELDLAPDLPPTTGDAIQLQQVVMNLMLNAFAAMDQPGRRTRRLVVRTRAAAGGTVAGGGRVPGHGGRDRGRGARPAVRAVRDHEARRAGDGPVDLPLDPRPAPRPAAGRQQPRRRRGDVLADPAGRPPPASRPGPTATAPSPSDRDQSLIALPTSVPSNALTTT